MKADVRLSDGSYMSDHGVVALQMALRTTTASAATGNRAPSAGTATSGATRAVTDVDVAPTRKFVLPGGPAPVLSDAMRERGLTYVLRWHPDPGKSGGVGRWEWRLDYDPRHPLGHHHRGDE